MIVGKTKIKTLCFECSGKGWKLEVDYTKQTSLYGIPRTYEVECLVCKGNKFVYEEITIQFEEVEDVS